MQKNSNRLCLCENIEDSQACIHLFADFIWRVIEADVHTSVVEEIECEAKLMFR